MLVKLSFNPCKFLLLLCLQLKLKVERRYISITEFKEQSHCFHCCSSCCAVLTCQVSILYVLLTKISILTWCICQANLRSEILSMVACFFAGGYDSRNVFVSSHLSANDCSELVVVAVAFVSICMLVCLLERKGCYFILIRKRKLKSDGIAYRVKPDFSGSRLCCPVTALMGFACSVVPRIQFFLRAYLSISVQMIIDGNDLLGPVCLEEIWRNWNSYVYIFLTL